VIKRVVKRNGRIVKFDPNRIRNAIKRAMLAVGRYDEKKLDQVVKHVLKLLEKKFVRKTPHVEEIQDVVEISLIHYDLYEVAKAYILYRKERERIREEKKRILGKDSLDEVDKSLPLDSIRVLAKRYLLKDEKGKFIEGPKQLFQRVAMLVVIPDILYDPLVFDKKGKQKVHKKEKFSPEEWEGKLGFKKVKWNRFHLERMKSLYDELNKQGKMKVPWKVFLGLLKGGRFEHYYKRFREYYELMVQRKFLPNSPTLFNAGTRLGQLSACFVLDVEDDLGSIMDMVKEAALIFKSGGGVGVNYSKLRPEGDVVRSTAGVASGPISFMRIVDTMTEVIKQGGRRRGANMGILEAWHPDIHKFIRAKERPRELENFNISVMLDGSFWMAYKKGKKYSLINPRNREKIGEVDPRNLLREISYMAWKTGDPGVLFKDNINKRNILRGCLGEIKATNPCGEEPLYPYESCNLGSINLYSLVKDGKFDWKEFGRIIRTCVRFLDNVIDVNVFPLKKIERNTKKTRKIGLGLMGLADALYALNIPYNSEEGFRFMRKVAEFLTYHAISTSCDLARERGPFPLFERSGYVKGEMPVNGFYQKELWTLNWKKLSEKVRGGVRNAEVTTIAPTGSISMIAGVSSGIEPQFSLVYEKIVPIGSFHLIDAEFEKRLRGMENSEALLKRVIQNDGSIQGLEEFPEEMRRVFVTSLDIPWWDHIRAQAEINQWICAAVSKTINLPHWASPDDVLHAYLFAHRLGCKGITIYREGSKSKQVIYMGWGKRERQEEVMRSIENRTLDVASKLGIRVEEGRVEEHVCPSCGSEDLIYESGCVKCPSCGWSECTIA